MLQRPTYILSQTRLSQFIFLYYSQIQVFTGSESFNIVWLFLESNCLVQCDAPMCTLTHQKRQPFDNTTTPQHIRVTRCDTMEKNDQSWVWTKDLPYPEGRSNHWAIRSCVVELVFVIYQGWTDISVCRLTTVAHKTVPMFSGFEQMDLVQSDDIIYGLGTYVQKTTSS